MMPRSYSAFAPLAFMLGLASCASHGSATMPPGDRPGAFNNQAAATRIFAAESGGGVLEFRATDNGNVAPFATISGIGAESPTGIAVKNGHLYVLTSPNLRGSHPALGVFPSTTDGSPPPSNIVQCAAMGLSTGVDVDSSGTAYVTNNGNRFGVNGSVSIFAANANGCDLNFMKIEGSNTGIKNPAAIHLGSQGQIYVANSGSRGVFGEGTVIAPSIEVFAPHSSGNVAPQRVIQLSNTDLDVLRSINLDANAHLYVAKGNLIAVYAPDASGNAAPIRTIQGNLTGLNGPTGVAIDAAGQIFVSNGFGKTNAILVFAPNANGNIAPIRKINVISQAYYFSLDAIALQ